MSMDAGSFFEKPTAASIAAAQPQGPAPEPLVTFTRPETIPPVQRDETWVRGATPQQINDAVDAGELHQYMGGALDGEGWPADRKGRRIEMGRGR